MSSLRMLGQKVKVVGHRKVKKTFWSVTYNFQDRPGSKFGPPIENEKNRFFTVSVYIRLHSSVICNPIVQLIYMGYAACETLQSLGLLLSLL